MTLVMSFLKKGQKYRNILKMQWMLQIIIHMWKDTVGSHMISIVQMIQMRLMDQVEQLCLIMNPVLIQNLVECILQREILKVIMHKQYQMMRCLYMYLKQQLKKQQLLNLQHRSLQHRKLQQQKKSHHSRLKSKQPKMLRKNLSS